MRTIKSNLSNVLFSKARQNVLALLYGQPDRSFHTNEIIRLTKSGTGSIQRELDKLSSVGLLTVEAKGNQKRYAANRASPLFLELRGIVLKDLLSATKILLGCVDNCTHPTSSRGLSAGSIDGDVRNKSPYIDHAMLG